MGTRTDLLSPEARHKAREMRMDNAANGLRRPVQVLEGNFDLNTMLGRHWGVAGVDGWRGFMLAGQSAQSHNGPAQRGSGAAGAQTAWEARHARVQSSRVADRRGSLG